jgi:thiol-disulfide isomerase/thioredoxin
MNNQNTKFLFNQSQQTFLQKITSFFTNMNWIVLLILAIFIILLVYFGYNTYKNMTSNTIFYSNTENMSNNEESNKKANLMLFYVDWCPHCKTAKPEWEKAKTEFDGKNINGYTIVFTEYNCTNETQEIEELMNKYKIEGYPTIKLVKDNEVIEYDAKPTKSTIEQFLQTVL